MLNPEFAYANCLISSLYILFMLSFAGTSFVSLFG